MEQATSSPVRERLWTRSFTSICVANFLLNFAFYLLLPVLPLYLIEVFGASKTMVGIVVSCYTVAALVVRPAAGFVLDMFNRRVLYLIAYFLFALCFTGYVVAGSIALLVLVRLLHGLAMGMVSTAGNSLVVDIMPSSRRGEGLGYFGVANNIAMATGPMISLFIHDHAADFFTIFYAAIASGVLGFVMANTVRTKKGAAPASARERQPVVLDRFFLVKGTSGGASLLFTAVPYGMVTTYVVIYGRQLGIEASMGIFFLLMAVGLISSRLFAGKLVDRGRLLAVIACGTAVVMGTYVVLASLLKLHLLTDSVLVPILFYGVAVSLGVGYGMLFPAYNTLFVNLAPHNRRATASSTYLTSWDIGLGLGLILGGRIADTAGGLPLSYLVGAFSVAISFVLFKKITAPHYERNKLV